MPNSSRLLLMIPIVALAPALASSAEPTAAAAAPAQASTPAPNQLPDWAPKPKPNVIEDRLRLEINLLGASATTALGLASLATSHVVAVRAFGIGAAVGVMVDFVMSLVLVPTLLTLIKPSPRQAPQERYFLGPMQRVARFSMRNAPTVVVATIVLMAIGTLGLRWLRVDTNHINFFAKDHPLSRSATLIDEELSGIYSFNILLEGEPESMKSPDASRPLNVRDQMNRFSHCGKSVLNASTSTSSALSPSSETLHGAEA